MATFQTLSIKGGIRYRCHRPPQGISAAKRHLRPEDGRSPLGCGDRDRNAGPATLPGRESARHTLADLLDRYQAEELPRFSSSTEAAKPGSPARVVARAAWAFEAGGSHLGRNLSQALSRLKARPVSEATRNRYHAALSHSLGVAFREWEWLPENPARRLRALLRDRGASLVPSRTRRSARRCSRPARRARVSRLLPLSWRRRPGPRAARRAAPSSVARHRPSAPPASDSSRPRTSRRARFPSRFLPSKRSASSRGGSTPTTSFSRTHRAWPRSRGSHGRRL